MWLGPVPGDRGRPMPARVRLWPDAWPSASLFGRSFLVLLNADRGAHRDPRWTCRRMFASAWLTRALATRLYGITPHDTLTFVMVPLLLLLVGALACLVPARRAANLDPLRALRGG
jgi:hypothetical protein